MYIESLEGNRMLDVSEMVLKGERFYRIMTAPLSDKSRTESIFSNVGPKDYGKNEDVKALIIREPYYEF